MNGFFDIFINYGTLLAYIAFSIDLGLQIRKIYSRHSSQDIAWRGTVARLIGCLVLVTKFVVLRDMFLIVGQSLFTLVVLTYLFAVLHYKTVIRKK